MAYRKRTEGFNLAFLDIMSCGLGAVILVFMLVKQNIDRFPAELENLKKDISSLQQARDQAIDSLRDISVKRQHENNSLNFLNQTLNQKQTDLSSNKQNLQRSQRELDQLKSSITSIIVPKKEDQIETQQLNEENYLLGLKVEGQKIAILVDTSASMTNEKLIDIIKTKNGSKQGKLKSAKWIRTQNVVKWLLARLPKNSDVLVVAFSENAALLGSAGWMHGSAAQTLPSIVADLNKVTPSGATNLQKGLILINKFSPSNLYIITDGLPTKGESRYKSLNPFASCNSLTGSSKTISGECRVKLFKQTISESGSKDMQVNVILLPLQGDPDAAYQYWSWTAITGGLVISPANNWP